MIFYKFLFLFIKIKIELYEFNKDTKVFIGFFQNKNIRKFLRINFYILRKYLIKFLE